MGLAPLSVDQDPIAIDLAAIWRKAEPPVIFKREDGQPLLVRVPFDPGNRRWLSEAKQSSRMRWNERYRCWEVPRSWFENLILVVARRLGSVWVVQETDGSVGCNESCRNARGLDCVCSCFGANHGSGGSGIWRPLLKEFAVGELHGATYSCRLVRWPRQT